MKFKSVLWCVFLYVVLPLAAWQTSRLLFKQDASTIGPFLFVSPGIALTVGGWTLMHMPWVKQMKLKSALDPKPADEEMELYGTNVATKSGFPRLNVKVSDRHFDNPQHDVTSTWEGDVLVYAELWADLDPGAREFAIARAYALRKLASSKLQTNVVWVAICFFGSLAATVNLWWIIPAQSAVAVGFALATGAFAKQADRADALALEWTRDLSAAIRYVRATTGESQGWPADRETRIQRLQDKGHELGLAASR